MTTSMFGAPLGIRTYENDQTALAQMAVQNRLAEEQILREQSLTRSRDAETRRLDARAAQERAMAERLAGGGGGEAPTLAELVQEGQRQAGIRFSAGDTEGAVQALSGLAQTVQRMGSAQASEARTRNLEMQRQMEQLQTFQGLLTGVRSQADLDRAVLAIQSMPWDDEDKAAVLEQLGGERPVYDPARVRTLLSGSEALYKKLEDDRKASETASRNADRESRRAYRDIVASLRERDTATREARESRLSKVQGPERRDRTPADGDIAAVGRELKAAGYELDKELAPIANRRIAEEAEAIRSTNPSISATEARAQAIRNAEQRGELSKTPGRFFGTKTNFEARQGGLASPLSLPSSADALKPGHYYRAPDGAVALWDGKSFVRVRQQPARAPGLGSPLWDYEDDEDEEE